MKEKLTELFLNNMHFYIAGAQSRAKTLAGQINFLYPETVIEAYLVDDLTENDAEIGSVPVLLLRKLVDFHAEYPVLIATKGIYHEKIRKGLMEKGFSIIIPVSIEVDTFFRNAYVEKVFGQENRSFYKVEWLSGKNADLWQEDREEFGGKVPLSLRRKLPTACIYIAKSIYDKPLRTEYTFPAYEKPIQVGAALTENRLSPDILTDDKGDNISEKNRQYCELTALYWIWKHAKEEVLGLSHYRRHFVLPQDWLERMTENQVDVILPVPTYVQPSIEENYKERHDASDWDFLKEYLKKTDTESYQTSKVVFAGNLYSPCNMFIMRREVLDELCGWMFPILDVITEHGGVKEDAYLNRYAGFISERLITLFFHKNKDKYRIVYADKNFLT